MEKAANHLAVNLRRIAHSLRNSTPGHYPHKILMKKLRCVLRHPIIVNVLSAVVIAALIFVYVEMVSVSHLNGLWECVVGSRKTGNALLYYYDVVLEVTRTDRVTGMARLSKIGMEPFIRDLKLGDEKLVPFSGHIVRSWFVIPSAIQFTAEWREVAHISRLTIKERGMNLHGLYISETDDGWVACWIEKSFPNNHHKAGEIKTGPGWPREGE